MGMGNGKLTRFRGGIEERVVNVPYNDVACPFLMSNFFN